MADCTATFLSTLINYEHQGCPPDSKVFHLKRMSFLLQRLHHPHRCYPVIHVVGTKGKGSTAACLASILRQAGLRVGLYTSPHLMNVKERIRILDPQAAASTRLLPFEGRISSGEFSQVLKKIMPIREQLRRAKLGDLTYFEALTAAAFYFFFIRRVDVAILEAGLGGRLDATNVSRSDLCIITSVSLDHTAQLGGTLSLIAKEKSAVIKPSTQAVFSAAQKPSVLSVIRHASRQHHAPLFQVGREIRYRLVHQDQRQTRFSLRCHQQYWPDLRLALLGAHQAENASLAASAASYFLGKRSGDHHRVIREGLECVCWPVRCEVLQRNPWIIADAAHNQDSMKKILETIKTIFPRGQLFVIFGASADKDIRGMLQELACYAQRIYLTQSAHPRAFSFSDPEKIKFYHRIDQGRLHVVKNCTQALRALLPIARAQDVILATGSVFIAGEVRALCQRTR